MQANAASLGFRTNKKVTEMNALLSQREPLSRAVHETDSWQQLAKRWFAEGEKLKT